MKAAFLSLEKQVVFAEPLEDLQNVLAMFSQALGIDKDVVYLHNHKMFQEAPEHLIHEIPEYVGGVDQAIWHNKVIIMSRWGNEGDPPFVPLTHLDEVVGASEVQLGKNGGSAKLLHSSWDGT